VACNLVIFSESPIEAGLYTSIPQTLQAETTTTVYPNPTNGLVHLDVDGSAYEPGSIIWIYNSSGKLMHYQRWDGTSTSVDLSGFNSGLYVLVIQTNKGLQVEKITKQ
jgi:pectate lyase